MSAICWPGMMPSGLHTTEAVFARIFLLSNCRGRKSHEDRPSEGIDSKKERHSNSFGQAPSSDDRDDDRLSIAGQIGISHEHMHRNDKVSSTSMLFTFPLHNCRTMLRIIELDLLVLSFSHAQAVLTAVDRPPRLHNSHNRSRCR